MPEVTDHNHPEATGVGPIPVNQRNGVRVSTAIAYLAFARHRPNLTIRPQTLVSRVLFDGIRAIGVEVESSGERQQLYGRRVTLAAGAVASPAILLRSGIGPAAELRALGVRTLLDLPGVGANLIDHPLALVMLVPKPGVADLANPFIQVFARYTAPGSNQFNDMQLYMGNHLPLAPLAGEEAAAMIGAPLVLAVGVALQRPRSRGRITLASADPHVQPQIELNYLADPEDLRRMVAGLRLAWQSARSPEIAHYAVAPILVSDEAAASDEALAGYLQATTSTIFHPVGTARMGPAGDAGAVVDQFGRVRGIEGLRVVDASIMPAIPRANTNLTVIMLGERIAEWMAMEETARRKSAVGARA